MNPLSAAVLSGPLAALPMLAAFGIFTVDSAVALAAVTYAIARRENLGPRPAIALAAIVIGTGPGVDA